MSQRFKITEAPLRGRALEQKNKPMFTILTPPTFLVACFPGVYLCSLWTTAFSCLSLPTLNEKQWEAKFGNSIDTHAHTYSSIYLYTGFEGLRAEKKARLDASPKSFQTGHLEGQSKLGEQSGSDTSNGNCSANFQGDWTAHSVKWTYFLFLSTSLSLLIFFLFCHSPSIRSLIIKFTHFMWRQSWYAAHTSDSLTSCALLKCHRNVYISDWFYIIRNQNV